MHGETLKFVKEPQSPLQNVLISHAIKLLYFMVKYYLSSNRFYRSLAKQQLGYYKRPKHINALIGILCEM
jgi:hypothetical protein